MKNYLEIAKTILEISCSPDEYESLAFLAPLYAAQAQAAAWIVVAEELKKLNSRTGRLAYIGACLADIAKEMEGR